MSRPRTLGSLKESGYVPRSVKDELRENVIEALRSGDPLFPGIVGYERTVIPQVVNALLARHNFILLGLRGQAKTRLLRALTRFLDEEIPALEGTQLNEDPLQPITAEARRKLAESADETPIRWISREERYQEKLATPDVTMADLIGDIDPVKAANRRLEFTDPEVIHYGVIPRTNRGIFAVNEIPDLAPRIQVGLLNILEEGDIQIRGFPIRIPLDLLMVFSANPEDYTNRGNLITPLKDRIESQINTHYPTKLEDSLTITTQESYDDRDSIPVDIPPYFREIIEEMGFEARKSEYVDQNSGVSARVTISALENLISNAERRAFLNGEESARPRISDLANVVPAITGKIELVYEGELEGTTAVARQITARAIKSVFTREFPEAKLLEADKDRDDTTFQAVIDWFASGNHVELTDETPTAKYIGSLQSVPGLASLADRFAPQSEAEAASGMEFILEGLCQYSMIAREEFDGGVTSYRDLLGDMLNQLKES